MEKLDKNVHNEFEKKYKAALKLAPNIESEWVLIQAARKGCLAAERTLYYLNYPLLIKNINTKSIHTYEGNMLDLISVAYNGIREAIRIYEPEYNVHFSAVFIPHALAHVRDFLLRNRLIYIPDNQFYKGVRRETTSLNAPAMNDDDSGLEMIDIVDDPNSKITDILSLKHTKHDVKKIISSSPDKENLEKIYKLVNEYPDDKPLPKRFIAKQLGMSTQALSNFYKRVLKHKKSLKCEV